MALEGSVGVNGLGHAGDLHSLLDQATLNGLVVARLGSLSPCSLLAHAGPSRRGIKSTLSSAAFAHAKWDSRGQGLLPVGLKRTGRAIAEAAGDPLEPVAPARYTLELQFDARKGVRQPGLSDAKTPGVAQGQKLKKHGIRSSHTAEVLFEDVIVPAENRIGEEGQGFHVIMETLDQSRAGVAAGAVCVARAAFEEALAYAKVRKTFDKPLIAQQAISFMLADMAIKIQAGRNLYLHAAWKAARGERAELIGVFDREDLLRRHRGRGRDRRGPDLRRVRVHARVSRRALSTRREDHADLRGNAADPAHRDRRQSHEHDVGVA